MKRLSIVAFASFYLLLSVGIAKSAHFCMGRPQSVSFFSFDSKKCPCYRWAETAKACCEDEHELVKIDDDHSAMKVVVSPQPSMQVLFSFVYCISLQPEVENISHSWIDLGPPKVPIYQAVCSLIFYESRV